MYEVGDAVLLTFTPKTPAGAASDATVVLSVELPDATSVSPSVTHGGVGEYSAVFVPTLAGRHVLRWSATGSATDAFVDVLNVSASVSPVAIISLAEARQHLNMPDDETVDDEELRTFINAASRVVERYLRETIARRTVVEDRWLRGEPLVVLDAAPIISLTSVVSPDGAYTWSGTLENSETGLVSLTSAVYGTARFTYVAGRSVVPDEYLKATQIITAHLWSTQRQPLVSAGFGGETVVTPGRGYLIPNQAAQLLGGRAPNRP